MELGLEVLLEVMCEAELERALGMRSPLLGVNNRDLESLEIDMESGARLIGLARAGGARLVVGESGIGGVEDLRTQRAAGARAFLVGEHLIRSADIAAAARTLVEA